MKRYTIEEEEDGREGEKLSFLLVGGANRYDITLSHQKAIKSPGGATDHLAI